MTALRVGLRRLIPALTSLLALACTLVLSTGSAQAFVNHNFLYQIQEVPAEAGVTYPGPLSEVNSMTVDEGHLWLAEHIGGTLNYRVDEFNDSTGALTRQLPEAAGVETIENIAVGHSTGEAEIYVGARKTFASEPEGAVAVFGESGALQETWSGSETPAKTLGTGTVETAVDGSTSLSDWAAGDVYVADRTENVIDVFKPQAAGKEEYVTQITGPSSTEQFGDVGYVAVSALNGDVLVSNGNAIDVFAPAALAGQYEFVREITGPPPTTTFGRIKGLAVDGGNGEVYVIEELESEENVITQFSESGTFIGRVTAATAPGKEFGEPGVSSVAVDPSSHDVFVGVRHHEREGEPSMVDAFGPDVVTPDVTTSPSSEVKTSGEGTIDVTFNGTVNPGNAGEASCAFAWGPTAEFGQLASCSATVPNGEAPVAVHAAVSGLEPDVTYYYRLEATNANGTNPGEAWQDIEFTAPGPGLRSSSVSDASAESATFDATIDPHGAATSYYFQYVDEAGYNASAADPYAGGAETPVAPGATLGSGESALNVNRHVDGLTASTGYHYRLVVVSELEPGRHEVFYGPDGTFTTQPPGTSFELPDNRQWELVSPPDEHGALLSGILTEALAQASADGDAMTYFAHLGATESEPQGADLGGQVLSVRGADGWTSKDIATNNSVPSDAATSSRGLGEYLFFSEDLSLALVEPQEPHSPFSPLEACTASGCTSESFPAATEYTSYVRHDDTCESDRSACFEPLLTAAPGYADVPAGTEFGEPATFDRHEEFLDATPSLEHVVLRSEVALTSTPISQAELYESSAGRPASERLQLVSILPESEGGHPVSGENVFLGSSEKYPSAGGWRPISDDGSRIFWTAGGSFDSPRQLYMRDTVKGETIRLGVPEPGAAGKGTPDPLFEAANADGSKVFFRDEQQLTVGASKVGYDLYQCEIVEEGGKDRCKLTDLTPENASGESGEVQNFIPGTSEDGSYVYFVANGVLAAGAKPGACKEYAKAGATCSLYVYHEGETKFIATLSYADEYDWGGVSTVYVGSIGRLTARVSPNGAYIAFMSDRSLTGYDNDDAVTGKPDEEVYLYDADSEKLVCASCNPTGARPVGVAVGELESFGSGSHTADLVDVLNESGGGYGRETGIAANLPTGSHIEGYHAGLSQPRYLSNSGRLFFNSSDDLVPQDIDGQEDVYEYEPPGVGSCAEGASTYSELGGGCINLISSGTSSYESGFLDASEGGGDVFFLTVEKLLPEANGDSLSVYDAHECTASAPCFPAPPAQEPECTTAESCREAPQRQPSVFGTTASATFSGAGDLTSAPTKPAVELTRKQKLAKALKACRKDKMRKRRAACEKQARRRYGGTARKTVKHRKARKSKRRGR